MRGQFRLLPLWIVLLLMAWPGSPACADETPPPPESEPAVVDDAPADAPTEEAEPAGAEEPEPAATKPAAPAPMKRPYLWVLDTQPRIFFCGTIHLPDPRVLVQPASVHAALDASELVLTEIDLRAPNLDAASQLMRLPPGHLLSRMLPKRLYDRTAAVLAAAGDDIKKYEHTKIWAVTFRLQFPKSSATGESSTGGVQSMDATLSRAAQKAGKQIGALESMSEQLRVFDGLGLNEQIRMLDSSVTAIENAKKGQPSSVNALLEIYLQGDENALYRYLCADMDPRDPNCCFIRKILDERNVRMLDRVFARRCAAPGQTVFVAVGAGHYPGPQGILSLLRRRGYQVRRVRSVEDLEVSGTARPAVHVVPRGTVPGRVVSGEGATVRERPQRVRRRVRRTPWFPFFGPRRCR